MADYTRPLKQYVAAGVGVVVECRRCGHTARFSSAALAARWGMDTDPKYLPFRCYSPRESDGRRCGSRDIRVLPDWPKGVVSMRAPGKPAPS